MPPFDHLIAFISVTLVLLVVPGPAVLYIAARSISQGRAAGLVSVLGVVTGASVHVVAAAAGLSALLVRSTEAVQYLRWAGAAYLIWLGVQRFRDGMNATDEIVEAPRQSLGAIYRAGVLVNILNPKTALFFWAFLPQFVDPARGAVALQFLILGLMFLSMAFVTDSIYALATSSVATLVRRGAGARRAASYSSGLVYLGLGVATLLGNRNK